MGGNIDWRSKKLQGFLDSHGGDLTLNLDRISRDLGLEVSGSHAARLFKRDLGIGVREYAKRKRLGAAAVSLRSGALPIKQIGASAGYQSAQDFSRAFRAMFNKSPTEFRHAKRRTAPKLFATKVTEFRRSAPART